MAERRIPMNGDEFDAFTGWRHFLRWKAGERKALKRRYNKRFRRDGRRRLDEQ